MKTFVLVHGSWQSSYCWEAVKQQLENNGQRAVLIDLPGHGQDLTPAHTLTLDTYSDAIQALIKGIEGKVILVAHSAGGMAITAAAEAMPDKVEKLIYVAGFLPVNGQSLMDLAGQDINSLAGTLIVPSADHLLLDMKPEGLVKVLCPDATPAVQQLVIDNYRSCPAIPAVNPVTLTDEKYGRVSKAYVHTTKDRSITVDFQKKMVSAAGIAETYTLESGHGPHLSMPDTLAELILEIAD